MPVAENVERRDGSTLDEVRLLTEMIRDHQAAITRLSEKRRTKIARLREHRITFREIAEAMGTTEQNVHKIISVMKMKAAADAESQ